MCMQGASAYLGVGAHLAARQHVGGGEGEDGHGEEELDEHFASTILLC
jgi:hypothetical protein